MSMLHSEVTGSAAAGTAFILPGVLRQRLECLAQQRGCASEALVLELLLEALERAEALPAGRCSTRLGHSSVGPVPLPFQQP